MPTFNGLSYTESAVCADALMPRDIVLSIGDCDDDAHVVDSVTLDCARHLIVVTFEQHDTMTLPFSRVLEVRRLDARVTLADMESDMEGVHRGHPWAFNCKLYNGRWDWADKPATGAAAWDALWQAKVDAHGWEYVTERLSESAVTRSDGTPVEWYSEGRSGGWAYPASRPNDASDLTDSALVKFLADLEAVRDAVANLPAECAHVLQDWRDGWEEDRYEQIAAARVRLDKLTVAIADLESVSSESVALAKAITERRADAERCARGIAAMESGTC